MEFLELPEDVLHHVVSFLTLNSLKNLSRTCKYLFYFTESQITKKSVIHFQYPPYKEELRRIEEFNRNGYPNLKLTEKPKYELGTKLTMKNVYVMSSLSHLNNECLEYVSQHPKVQNIFLCICSRQPDDLVHLQELVRRPDKNYIVDEVSLSFKTLTDILERIEEWVRCFPTIRILNLHVEKFKFVELSKSKNRSIRKFRFERMKLYNIGDIGLISSLVNSSPALQHIKLENCLMEGLTVQPQLTTLSAKNYLSKLIELEKVFGNQINLESLNMSNTEINKNFLDILNKNTYLTNAKFSNCSLALDTCPEDFIFTSHLTNLTLNWSDTILCSSWEHFGKLEYLHLAHSEGVSKDQSLCSDLPYIDLPRLKHLEIANDHYTNVITKKMTARSLNFCCAGFNICRNIPQTRVLKIKDFLDKPKSKELFKALKEQNPHLEELILSYQWISLDLLKMYLKSELNIKTLKVELFFWKSTNPYATKMGKPQIERDLEIVLKWVRKKGEECSVKKKDKETFVIYMRGTEIVLSARGFDFGGNVLCFE
ncbi:hypothetical protein ACFFRR_004153 [Megaselia abdita]